MNSEEMLRRNFSKFVDNEIIPQANALDEKETFPRDLFKRLADMGCYSIRYPRNVGGSAANNTHFCIMCEELARGSMSVAAFTAMQCLMGTDFLFKYGTAELKEKYWKPAMRGEKVAAFCLTEPGGGTDLAAVTTMAKKTAEDIVITGYKTWVTNGPVASFYTILCQTDPAKKFRGLNFFFVPRDTPGVSLSKSFSLLGTRTTPICELALTDVKVPHHHMLCEEGRGFDNLLSILAEIRSMTAALGIGLVRAALHDCIRYAHERVAFGKTIGSYQLIQAKIAEMYVDLEAAKLLTYRATHLIDNKIACLPEATVAKYFATEAACKAGDYATRIFGAYGYSMEYTAQRYFRDNRFLLYGGGTHEILLPNIARWAGL